MSCFCQSFRQSVSQPREVLHCTCFAYKHSVNIKSLSPVSPPVLKCSRAAVDISNNLQSLLSICKQSRIWNPASIVSFFPPPSLDFRPLTVYTCGKKKRGDIQAGVLQNKILKITPKLENLVCFHSPCWTAKGHTLQYQQYIFLGSEHLKKKKIPLNATAVKHITSETEQSQTCVRNKWKFGLQVIMWPR